ncbi:MAG TPA: DUF3124 domain-containing protein [Leptolyngbyaceae cyanobacterium M33_DOE_097]|nr:DUF3124 domain-containing protein [Leptolyngbyaceae cyanobacterium M33_DOE_097]
MGLTACATQGQLTKQSPLQTRQTPLQEVTVDLKKVAIGQTVYVPIYSHIYHFNNQAHVMNLSATLSVRNTDFTNPIIITSVRYYDTDGQLVRQDVNRPLRLNPLASTSFFVSADDSSGGSGANFIVEWVGEKMASEPVIEAVMISTSSSQGISFVSSGKVLQQRGKSA